MNSNEPSNHSIGIKSIDDIDDKTINHVQQSNDETDKSNKEHESSNSNVKSNTECDVRSRTRSNSKSRRSGSINSNNNSNNSDSKSKSSVGDNSCNRNGINNHTFNSEKRDSRYSNFQNSIPSSNPSSDSRCDSVRDGVKHNDNVNDSDVISIGGGDFVGGSIAGGCEGGGGGGGGDGDDGNLENGVNGASGVKANGPWGDGDSPQNPEAEKGNAEKRLITQIWLVVSAAMVCYFTSMFGGMALSTQYFTFRIAKD